jgi:membrane-bound lytic murein transglycosylase D
MKFLIVIFLSTIITACENITVFFDENDEKIIREVIAKNQQKQQNQQKQPNQPIKPVKTNKYYHNLWDEISANHSLTGYEQDNGLYWHLKWFKENPDYLTRVTKRATPYLKIIVDEVKKRDLPYELALLPIVESAFYPFSYSHGTASGLWQFIPSTGKLYGLRQDFWVDERRDVVKSTNAALNYLENLYTLFGDWQLAIASYNSGPGRVQRAIAKNKKQGKKADFWHIKLPAETRGYLPRLLAVAKLIQNPAEYGQVITPVANKDVLQNILLKEQLDVALIAEFSDLNAAQIYDINPALNRFATPKNYNLLLPIEKVAKFKNSLNNYPTSKRVSWIRYKVKSGDSINRIANKYNVDTQVIKELNALKTNKIIIGDYLLVPLSKQDISFYQGSVDNAENERLSVDKKKIIYTVKKGDSLWEISRRFKVSVKDLIRWNKLPSRTIINIGDKLAIYQQKPTKITTLIKRTKLKPEIKRNITYTVKQGDSLWKIARKFKVGVNDIRTWNNLEQNKALKVGKKLKLEVNIVHD